MRKSVRSVKPKIAWLLPSLCVLLLSVAGCSGLNMPDWLSGKQEQPESEIVVQSPPAYGTVTQVTSALSKDREIRRGDLAITVDLDDGQVLVVIQPEDDIYRPGDRVRILRDGKGLARVQIP